MVYAWLMGLGGWMGVAGSLSLLNHRIFSEHTKLSRAILLLGPFLGGTLGYGVSYVLSKLLAIQVDVILAMSRLDVALPLCILIPIITFLTGPLFFVTTILDFASSFSPKRGDTGGTDSVEDSTVQPSAPLPVIAESTGSSETVSSSEPVANVSGPTGPSESVETVSGPTGPSTEVDYSDRPGMEDLD